MTQFKTNIIVGTAVTLSYIATIPSFQQNYIPTSHKSVTTNLQEKASAEKNILDTSFTIDKTEEIIEFINNLIGENNQIEIKRYSDAPNYHYIDVYNSDISLEDNFSNVEVLNDQSIKQKLNYIFVVGG